MALQRSFEDLGVPLSAVTFCVLDLETTGGSPASAAITEIGALKVCRGETVGTFHTLVDPRQAVPAFVRVLTGISDDMVTGQPDIAAVLPALLEFIGDSVLVAHNARFDVGFINAALRASAYPELANRVVDTAILARKMLAGEIPDARLATLARHLRCPHQPTHRAFADVLATTDVLHHLIERAAGWGVTTLEDLTAFSAVRRDGSLAKLALTGDLPRGPGVYRFVGAGGKTLYVGKAADVRSRVRSYFYGDPRRGIRSLLRETESIRADGYHSTLEAEVAEARAIARERPPFNRVGKAAANWYLKIGPRRISTARSRRTDGALYFGPVTARTARALVEILRHAAPVHRCTDPRKCRGCAFAEMGSCAGPSLEHVAAVADGAGRDPKTLLHALERRMRKLAGQGRFEEAAEVRDRGLLLERVVLRRLEAAALIAAGEVVLDVRGRRLVVHAGRLALDGDGDEDVDSEREAGLVSRWVRRNSEVRVVSAQHGWALPVTLRPSRRFVPQCTSEH